MRKILFLLFSAVFFNAHAQKGQLVSNQTKTTENLSDKELYNTVMNLVVAKKVVTGSSESEIFQLDSTITYLNIYDGNPGFLLNKRIYSYNDKLNLVTIEEQTFIPTTTLILTVTLDSVYYDDNGNTVNRITMFRDSENWKTKKQFISTYNSNENLISYEEKYFNFSLNEWRDNLLSTYTYNKYGEKTSALKQYRDTIKNVWVNINQELFTFNDQFLTNSLYQEWKSISDSNQWVNSAQSLYKTDAKGNIESELTQLYHTDDSLFYDMDSLAYTYDILNNITSKTLYRQQYNYLFETLTWVYDTLWTYTYSKSGKILNFIRQYYEDTTWTNLKQKLYTYDDDGNLSSEKEQVWNTTDGIWNNSTAYMAVYDKNGNITSDTLQTYSVSGSNPILNAEIQDYYRTSTGTTTDPSNPSKNSIANTDLISIYPNPADNILSISGLNGNTSYSIVDITGKLQSSGTITENHVYVGNLKSGIYVIKLTGGQGTYTSRFIKK